MKILIFILLVIPCYSQNFMMQMDVQESREDTTIYLCNEKVIWGVTGREICFLWGDEYPMCFTEEKLINVRQRKLRDKIKYYIEQRERDRYLKLRDLFKNQWGELFLITIYWHNGVAIWINRIDGKYPHYFLTITH